MTKLSVNINKILYEMRGGNVPVKVATDIQNLADKE
jgi:hypothetical protein